MAACQFKTGGRPGILGWGVQNAWQGFKKAGCNLKTVSFRQAVFKPIQFIIHLLRPNFARTVVFV